MRLQITVMGTALAVLLLISGCSGGDGAQDTTDIASDKADSINAEPEKEQEPRNEQETITLDTRNGDLTMSSTAEIPPTFPEEIPLPEDSVIMASMEQVDIGSSMVVFDANQPFETVVQLYKDFLAETGYLEAMPVTEDAELYWFAGARNTEQLVVIINKDLEREGRTTGTLTYKNES